MPLSFVVFAFFLALCAVMGMKMRREWQASTNNLPRKLAICVGGVCMVAFCEWAWIGIFPSTLLERIELPNAPGADRLIAPDGRVFIVSSPIARVQRYGPEGFEKGFMYGSKATAFWMSSSGNLLICATGDHLLTYTPDGAEVLPRRSCKDAKDEFVSSSSYPSHARVPAVAFNWLSILAVPFWHPLAAWLIAFFAGLLAIAVGQKPAS